MENDENEIKKYLKEEVNWIQEMEGAAVPAAHDFLKMNRNKFLDRVAKKGLNDLMNANGNAILEKKAISKMENKAKSYDFFKNLLGIKKEVKIPEFGKFGKISGGPLDAIFFLNDMRDIWRGDNDADFSKKMYESGKSLYGTLGGLVGAAIAGAAFGSIGGPLGIVIGFAAGIVGSIIGGWIGKAYYDLTAGGSNITNYRLYAGIDCSSFRSGGIEFFLPKPIKGFEKNIIFDRCHFIAFEYNDDNNFNINQIIDLVNSNFLLGNIKFNNINEIYDTILKEVACGFLCQKKLPEISLNFNKEALLYSIMDTFYKNTITGNVLTFLDYYLKSYVNGGFFKEEFIYRWQNNKNTNRDYLQRNFVDFKKYLYDLTHDPNKINYYSMHDLGQTSENENNYMSAFRIIGYMNDNIKYYKNILFPKCSYFSQYDFDILPFCQSKINKSLEEKHTADNLEYSHKIMNYRVKYLMNKIPFLKPYFELLKMITFAVHYLPNVQRCGLFRYFKMQYSINILEKNIVKVFLKYSRHYLF